MAIHRGLLLALLATSASCKNKPARPACPDLIEISVAYPGASADEVDQRVVLAIEQRVSKLKQTRAVESIAASGLAAVFVEYDGSVDQALHAILDAVAAIDALPEGAEPALVSRVPAGGGAQIVVLHSDAMTTHSLSSAAADIAETLRGQTDVASVNVIGGFEPALTIEVDPEALAAHGLSFGALADSIQRRADDLRSGDSSREADRLRTLAETAVLSRPDGTWLRLSDVATISVTDRSGGFATFRGRPAVVLLAWTGDGAKAIGVDSERLPPDATVTVLPSFQLRRCGARSWSATGLEVISLSVAEGGDARESAEIAKSVLASAASKEIVSDALLLGGHSILPGMPHGPGRTELILFGRDAAEVVLAEAREHAGVLGNLVVPRRHRLDVTLSGSSPEKLSRSADVVSARFAGRAEVVGVDRRPRRDRKPEARFEVTTRARQLGVSQQAVARVMRGALEGEVVARVQIGRDVMSVSLVYGSAGRAARLDPAELGKLPVQTSGGETVPLAELVELSLSGSDLEIHRRNGERTVVITAVLASADDRKVVADGLDRAIKATLDPEVRVHIE